MPLFTFYPYRGDGAATAFEAFDLDSPNEAMVRARELLTLHESAETIEVWLDDQLVLAVSREEAVTRELRFRAVQREDVS